MLKYFCLDKKYNIITRIRSKTMPIFNPYLTLIYQWIPAMRLINLLDNCGQLVSMLSKASSSVNRIAENFFRSKRKIIGSKERKIVSQIAFDTIRNFLLIEKIIADINLNSKISHPKLFQNSPKYSLYVLVQLVFYFEYTDSFQFYYRDAILYKNGDMVFSIWESLEADIRTINGTDDILKYLKSDFVISTKKTFDMIDDLFVRYSYPKEFINILSSYIDCLSVDLVDLLKGMNCPAKLCVRANTSLMSVEELIKELKMCNISCKVSSFVPSCVHIDERQQLTNLDLYKKGYFTIQDEGSQLVGYCISPNPTDTILDVCAGAGGKSLHLADMQNNKGLILSSDISHNKLLELHSRARLSGFNSITTKMINIEKSDSKTRLKNPTEFDIVLVDAPCSGS